MMTMKMITSPFLWVTLLCLSGVVTPSPVKKTSQNQEGDDAKEFEDVPKQKRRTQFISSSNPPNYGNVISPQQLQSIILRAPPGTVIRTRPNGIASPFSIPHSPNRFAQSFNSVPKNHIQRYGFTPSSGSNFVSGIDYQRLPGPNSNAPTHEVKVRNQQLSPDTDKYIAAVNSIIGGSPTFFLNSEGKNGNFGQTNNQLSLNNNNNNNNLNNQFNNNKHNNNFNSFPNQLDYQQQLNAQFQNSPSFNNGLKHFESQLTSNEDVLPNTENASPFGISLLSNDGFGNSFGLTSIVPDMLPSAGLSYNAQHQSLNENVHDKENAESYGKNDEVKTIDAVDLSSSDSISNAAYQHNNQPFSNNDDFHATNIPFTVEPFGIPQVDFTDEQSGISQGILQSSAHLTEDDLSEVRNAISSLQPTPVELNSAHGTSVSHDAGNNFNNGLDPILDPLKNLTHEEPSQLNDLLGGLTLGELLMGINGQNGIVVLPMSSADKLKDNTVFPESSEISVREVDDLEEQVVTTTTRAPPRSRRPSRRRTTTKPPDHIRVALSDLLYAKGQWFGTLLGGMVDFGRIAIDAFKDNIDTSSREPYA